MYKNFIYSLLVSMAFVAYVAAMETSAQQTKTPFVELVEFIKYYNQDPRTELQKLSALKKAIKKADLAKANTSILHFSLNFDIDNPDIYKELITGGADASKSHHGQTPLELVQGKIKELHTTIKELQERMPKLREELENKRTFIRNKYAGISSQLGYIEPIEITDLRGQIKAHEAILANLEKVARLFEQAQQEKQKTAGSSDSPVRSTAGAGKLNESPVLRSAGAGAATVADLPAAPGGPSNVAK